MKRCAKCGQEKHHEQFHKNSKASDGLAVWCRDCSKAYRKAWLSQPQNKVRLQEYAIRRDHGVSLAEMRQIIARQEGRCAICRIQFDVLGEIRPCLDHNHATEQRRGVLCPKCNVALGLLGDSPERLRAAAAYLDEWREKAESMA